MGGDTADVNTWSAGQLRPGESQGADLEARRLARPARYTIDYRVAPGPDRPRDGGRRATPAARFAVRSPTSRSPPAWATDGKVERGARAGSDC